MSGFNDTPGRRAADAVGDAAELLQSARASLSVDLQLATDLHNLARERLKDAERGGGDPIAVRRGRAQLFEFALAEFAPATARWALTLDDEQQRLVAADLAAVMRASRNWLAEQTQSGNVVSPLFQAHGTEWAEMIDELTQGAKAA